METNKKEAHFTEAEKQMFPPKKNKSYGIKAAAGLRVPLKEPDR